MRTTVDGPTEGQRALDDYLFDRTAATPDEVRTKLRGYTQLRSPVECCVQAAELIYARRGACPGELVDIGAALAVMCAAHGFFGMDIDSRGSRMALAMRGEETDAPEPKAEYLAADEPDGEVEAA